VLSLDVVQVVGEASGLPFYELAKRGEIRTSVKINGRPIDYLNRYITTKNETPERIRIPIPAGVLRAGRNLVRIEQAGEAGDPSSLDDLGILEIAVEFPVDRPSGAGPKQP
jgi:hypothetical protein